jgi:transcriptional regulator with PAS, ATPase and Fis domain
MENCEHIMTILQYEDMLKCIHKEYNEKIKKLQKENKNLLKQLFVYKNNHIHELLQTIYNDDNKKKHVEKCTEYTLFLTHVYDNNHHYCICFDIFDEIILNSNAFNGLLNIQYIEFYNEKNELCFPLLPPTYINDYKDTTLQRICLLEHTIHNNDVSLYTHFSYNKPYEKKQSLYDINQTLKHRLHCIQTIRNYKHLEQNYNKKHNMYSLDCKWTDLDFLRFKLNKTSSISKIKIYSKKTMNETDLFFMKNNYNIPIKEFLEHKCTFFIREEQHTTILTLIFNK